MHYVEAKGILSPRNGMNIYRGCTHGCIYCDSRSRCYGMDHPFEDVAVKKNAPQLLDAALGRKRRRCMIGTGSMCDPYLPLEATEGLTRRCLEVIARHGFGLCLLTKSDLVLRDLDLLQEIGKKARVLVCTTLTTYDETLCAVLEPGVCGSRRRFEALRILRDAGIETGVWLAPVLPFLTDTVENLEGILDYCFCAGVKCIVNFSMGLTLREGNREYFYEKLDTHFPGMKDRYIRHFGGSYECLSPDAPRLTKLFREACAAHGVIWHPEAAMAELVRFEDRLAQDQLCLF